MKLIYCCFVAFLLFVHSISAIDSQQQPQQPTNDQQQHDNDNQLNRPNQVNDIKRSQDDEETSVVQEELTKQTDQENQHVQASNPFSKKSQNTQPIEKQNDKANEKPVDDLTNEYIYIKIKPVNTDDDRPKDETNSVDEDERQSTDNINSPVRKTLNIGYDYKIEKLDKLNKDDPTKEITLTDSYPKVNLVEIQFKRNENSRKVHVEEDDEPPVKELTKEQQLGKQIFEDALPKLDTNRMFAYKLIDQAASLGYKEAKDFLLHGLVFGDFDIGFTAVKEKLDYYSRRGDSLAQMFYGFFYASGIFFKPSQASALLYYTMSAAANNTYAQMALGYRYWYGINVKQNCPKALKYYRKVAKQVEKTMSTIPAGIIERKRLFDENENPTSYSVLNPDMIKYYQVLAENGDTLAQIAVGQIHYQGMRGIPKDHRKALKFLEMAAESKNSNAMAYLGKMYLEGSDVIEQNYEKAKAYFTSAIEKNSAAGYCGLGTMYLYGKGVEKDYAKAFRFFNKAAEQGLVEAQYQIGIMYYNGYGVAQNYQDAFKYFYLASQAGYVLGYYYLAIMHAEGLGTQRSCSNAVELFKNVAERGTWSKILMDAFTDYKESNILDSYVKYSFLSELGYEVAQSNAASLLDNDELNNYYSSNESYTRAFMYWSRSATQGYSVARVKLGDYYYYGQGVHSDFELAAAQYRLASDRSAQALFNLGYMHEQGLGLKKDFYLAKRYYDQAADSSHEAGIPVLLAKIKLYTIHFFESLGDLSFEDILLDAANYVLIEDWDLYLLTILIVLLGCILRRNR